MAVTENDLEMLDGYLDDALEMGEVEALRARLAGDVELASALEQVRSERAARRSFFAALEPDDAEVAKLTARVRASIDRRADFSRLLRPLRYLGALAACLAIGFFARGLLERPHAGDPSNLTVADRNRSVQVEKLESYQVTLRDDSGKIVGVQHFNSFEKAQEFAADLARWQSRSERLASGQFVLHNDRF